MVAKRIRKREHPLADRHLGPDAIDEVEDRIYKLRSGSVSRKGRYVKWWYGPVTSFTEVQAHPLHVVASRDLASSFVDSPKHRGVVDDVPQVVADLLESDVLARERVAQEALTRESEGATTAHSAYFEVTGVVGLREAARIRSR